MGGVFLFVTLAILVTVVYLMGASAGGTFGTRRASLNQSLREAILTMGIRPDEREVVETRDRIIDGSASWFVLNWRVKVRPDFDFAFARQRLEQVIRNTGGEPGSYWNSQDPVIPLKTEAFIDKRLSHRIFFTVEAAREEPRTALTANTQQKPALARERAQSLEGIRLVIDRVLQRTLPNLHLNGPPFFISEYWESDTNGFQIAHWVITVSAGADLGAILPALSAALPPRASVARFKASPRTGLKLAIEITAGNQPSHRLFFTTYPAYRGRNAERWQKTDAIYIAPPRVALIIDDIGTDRDAATKLLAMDAPITLSILPHRPFSTEIALRARKMGAEIMLHLPMEPESYPRDNPGAGGIFVGYPADEIRTITAENIDAVPAISGVNNHMGSKAMTDAETVTAVLEVIRARKLYFVDSRTSAQSIGLRLARGLNIPANERTVFIDSTDRTDIQYRLTQLAEVIRKAKENGSCIAIGHPSPETITAISQMLPRFREAGIVIVYASDLVS